MLNYPNKTAKQSMCKNNKTLQPPDRQPSSGSLWFTWGPTWKTRAYSPKKAPYTLYPRGLCTSIHLLQAALLDPQLDQGPHYWLLGSLGFSCLWRQSVLVSLADAASTDQGSLRTGPSFSLAINTGI